MCSNICAVENVQNPTCIVLVMTMSRVNGRIIGGGLNG